MYRRINTLGILTVVAVASIGQSAARGSLVISNLGQAAAGVSGTDFRFGQGVVAGSTVSVNSITVSLEDTDRFFSESETLLIRNGPDSSSSVLYTLLPTTVTTSATPTNFVFTAPANTILNAGTTYYVALSTSPTPGFAGAAWAYNTSGGTGDAGWSLPPSLNNPSTGRHMLAIDATVIPVPEPALIGLGLAGLLLVRGRRNRPA